MTADATLTLHDDNGNELLNVSLSEFEMAKAERAIAARVREIKQCTAHFRVVDDLGVALLFEAETGTGELAQAWIDPLGVLSRVNALLPRPAESNHDGPDWA